MKPTRTYRALRALVATAVIAVVLGLWAHGQVTGRPLDMLWDVVILALVVAAGYTVFGRETMGQAIADAQEMASEGDEGGDVGGARVSETPDEDPRTEGNDG